MGNCCCEAESPCGSIEERSVLLKDDSKTSCAGERVAVGACGPEDNNDMSQSTAEEAKEVKEEQQRCQNKEREPRNTQGNGHLQKGDIQEVSAPPNKERGSRKEDDEKEDAPSERCTLNQPQVDVSSLDEQEGLATNGEPNTENVDQTAVQEDVSPPPESSRPENLPSPETNPLAEEDKTDGGSHADSGEDAIGAEAKPSEQFTRSNEALSEPSTQAASISAVSQDTNTEAPSCSVEGSVETKSHVISEPLSPGSEPTDLNHAQEKPGSVASEPTSATEAKDSLKSDLEDKKDPEGSGSAEENVEEAGEDVCDEGKKDEEDGKRPEKVTLTGETEAARDEKQLEIQEQLGEDEPSSLKSDVEMPADEEAGQDDSDIDLYRGEEELSASPSHKLQPASELKIPKVQDSCSLSPAVDILSYSEREWRGKTAKSALIRKGYEEMSAKFSHLRRVRGDNYCALRATLFQVLSQSDQVPQWLQEDTVLMLPKQLEAQDGLISQWRFPGHHVNEDGVENPIERLKGYMELLRQKWKAAADCPGAAARQQLCERLFQGEEEELGMLEALKLLMLGRASELHGRMQVGEDVPLFCWLLFARDSSDCPRSFLSNHLSYVGLSAGLEQVEMFLLGYALQHTIQVYRLYKANTEEFVTFYPDDHRDDWPSVCLVTEDDRHYNVPVVEAADPCQELPSS
ncbi:PREDICTED: ubiquitin thioesterase otulin [Cyprinodon variegatus]|uniref:OTU deubiquitinase with linear linkage specificity n=1 Tax=Cyprinodon variegatus TaxID=28743 RepID=A0A3Q2GG75_CYPVA|nr:PREDICTED: ubiquitin thioesterase otulin [Cyprinodon variegatus]